MDGDELIAGKVLLSWSMDRSKAVATALRRWLPGVVQLCEPWMSDTDIHLGKRWRREIADHLPSARVGVVCVTPENLDRRWINYEAGALSARMPGEEQVIAYCFDMDPVNCGDPLGDFFGARADKPGTLRLVKAINSAMPRPINEIHLEAVFESMWPSLDRELRAIGPAEPTAPQAPKRDAVDLLEELLERVKGIEAHPVFDVGPFGRGGAIGRMVSTRNVPKAVDGSESALGVFHASVAPRAAPATDQLGTPTTPPRAPE